MIIMPMFFPTPIYSGGGGYTPSSVGVPEWKNAPKWARYVYLTSIGEWKWVHYKPSWDWFIGVWKSESYEKSVGLSATVYDRSARKKSMQKRPAEFGKATEVVDSKVMTVVDWTKAPAWAKYACINSIGRWEWWAEKPSWDSFIGVYRGSIRSSSALLDALDYSSSARKASLTKRP